MALTFCAEGSEQFEIKRQISFYLTMHDHIDKCLIGTTVVNSVDRATFKENEKLDKADLQSREHYISCWDISKLYDLQTYMEIEFEEKEKVFNTQQEARDNGMLLSDSPFSDKLRLSK